MAATGLSLDNITPEAFMGGALTIVKDGDQITIDAQRQRIHLNISDEDIKSRLSSWKQPAPRYTRGVLAKYAKVVSSASVGAITDGE